MASPFTQPIAMNRKIPIVSVVGPNEANCTEEVYQFGLWLGKQLVDLGCRIACGGMGGIMEAVCKGARLSANYQHGATIGIIPAADKAYANKYCDIVIPTGLGLARNFLVVNTGEVVIAVSGGPGTLSEIAYTLQLNKRTICYTGFPGWASDITQCPMLENSYHHVSFANNPDELVDILESMVNELK